MKKNHPAMEQIHADQKEQDQIAQSDLGFDGQIVLVGTVQAEIGDHGIANGARCALVSVIDCDRLAFDGKLDAYMTDEGLNAGLLLDDTLGLDGWSDIKIHACLPVADKLDGWEPELLSLIIASAQKGIAHMVFEPDMVPANIH